MKNSLKEFKKNKELYLLNIYKGNTKFHSLVRLQIKRGERKVI